MAELKQELRNLHSELADAEPATDDLREHVEQLSYDVKEILDHPGDIPFEQYRSLAERLTESVEQFELEHPRLTAAVQSVLSALNSIGA